MIRGVLGSRASIGGVLGSGRGGASNGLLTGLVAYWALDEVGGANNALDKHSGGLTLTASASAPTTGTGKVYATARSFTAASTQYFSRASETATETGNIDYAIAAWVYFTSASGARVPFSKAIADSGIGYEFALFFNSTFRFVIGNNAALQVLEATNFGAASINTWYLVTAWQDTTANKIYISVNNGTPNEATRTVTPVAAATKPINVGRTQDGRYYVDGRIGPICMWKNRTLDATARAALYNGGNGLAYSAFTA